MIYQAVAEEARERVDQEAREAAVEKVKRLMVEIDLLKANLKMAEEQLEDMMGQEIDAD